MLTTQIGGSATRNSSIFIVKYKLKKAGMVVKHPLNDGFALMQGRYFTFNPRKWQRYEVELDYFENIRSNQLHIVCNDSNTQDGTLDYDTCLGVLQAMLHHKPIILTRPGSVATKQDLFMHEMLQERLAKVPVINVRAMNSTEIKSAIAALPAKVDYHFSLQQVVLAKIRLKAYFRHILHPYLGRRTFFAAINRRR